jgi:ABC-type lipoprotein export system ATPase subunit
MNLKRFDYDKFISENDHLQQENLWFIIKHRVARIFQMKKSCSSEKPMREKMGKISTLVQCKNLVKIYQTNNIKTFGLSGLDLNIESGEVVAIVGPSGSGKSTLLNILGGLDKPTSGEAMVGGVDLLSLTPDSLVRYRRDVVGFVWQQNARNLLPHMSALQNVCLPMKVAGFPRKRQIHLALGLLEAVGIAERVHHRTSELSGGEQQRVAIAIALANSPGLLLADEPTGSVDTQTAKQIIELFKDLSEDFGVTVVIVSHDPKISQFVDRTIAIYDGRTSFERIHQSGLDLIEGGDEYVIVDQAGRFQIPPELIERLGIKERARLHLADDHIEIWPSIPKKNNE